MKEAMWKVDESGEFRFSDATDPNQMMLFDKTPDLQLLQGQIVHRFAGVDATIREIDNFVVVHTGRPSSPGWRELPVEVKQRFPD